jgi:hypothetical protein
VFDNRGKNQDLQFASLNTSFRETGFARFREPTDFISKSTEPPPRQEPTPHKKPVLEPVEPDGAPLPAFAQRRLDIQSELLRRGHILSALQSATVFFSLFRNAPLGESLYYLAAMWLTTRAVQDLSILYSTDKEQFSKNQYHHSVAQTPRERKALRDMAGKYEGRRGVLSIFAGCMFAIGFLISFRQPLSGFHTLLSAGGLYYVSTCSRLISEEYRRRAEGVRR